MEFSINAVVCLAASADLPAKFPTSSATTANPFPAEPALAASTAAFNASMFVWNAISSMTLIILPISLDELLISSIAESISFICMLPCSTSLEVSKALLPAFSAFSALCTIVVYISLISADNSSIALACSVVP